MLVKKDPEFSYLTFVCWYLLEKSQRFWPGTGKNAEFMALYLGLFLQISLESSATYIYPGRCGMVSTGKHIPLSLHLHFNEYTWDNHTTLNYSCSKGEQATAEGSHSETLDWILCPSLSPVSTGITALHSEKHKGTHSQASDNPSLTAAKN